MAILPTFRVPDTLGEYPYTKGDKNEKMGFFFLELNIQDVI